MNAKKIFRTVETHTLGQPTRNIIGGFPHVPGSTMTEKFIYMKEHEDWFRTLMSYEPRGNDYMSCTLVTEPCTPGTDVGVLYFETSGWLPMCGHDTIGLSVALIETGMVTVTEPITTINLDTAAGVIRIEAKVENGSVKEVSFANAPAFVLRENLTVETKDYGKLTMDVAWGGNLYAIMPAESIGITIDPKNTAEIIHAAQSIACDINRQVDFHHPDLPFVYEVTHVEFYGPPKNPRADIQNTVVALPKTVDRSPCGTGTSAKSAVLYQKGMLRVGESFVHESIIGSCFRCEIVEETEFAGFKAVVPKVTGNAHIQGFATWILDPDDPFPKGFLLV
ncbi:proline racemase family protein [Emergencia timonensis]|uniref:proline racemase family protein n=1 Tax=Emergencia timonensis TaxID=1776384 RepID=UPI003992844D